MLHQENAFTRSRMAWKRFSLVLFLSFILLACQKKEVTYVRTVEVVLDSLEQVTPLSDSLVIPILYSKLRGFNELPTRKAKDVFISAVLPAILVAKQKLENQEMKLLQMKKKANWNVDDSTFFQDMRLKYRAKNLDELLGRIGTVPNSVVLAQAAVETGWGQSRFFTEANNIFGIWSWSENDFRVAARSTRGQDSVFLKSYPDLTASVIDYFELLGRGSSFEKLRRERNSTNDPFRLITHLLRYSEGRQAYIKLLENIIRQNGLTRYDHYRIHSAYIGCK